MSGQDEHPCATCARLQRTCCQRAEIVITAGDRARIARHVGADDFWSDRAPEDPSYVEPDPDDPEWAKLTVRADGTRRVLRRRPGGDCVFLGAHGCTLPEGVRPLVCRLYPFAYTARGLAGIDDGYCPTTLLLPPAGPGATMLTVLRMRPEQGERWRSALYDELRSGTESPCGSA